MLYDPINDYTPEGKVFIKAARYIEEHGHAKGVLKDEQGRACLLGAMNIVIGGKENCANFNVEDYSLNIRCRDVIRKKLGTYLLATWNNDPRRTAEDVINLLKTCAEGQKIKA